MGLGQAVALELLPPLFLLPLLLPLLPLPLPLAAPSERPHQRWMHTLAPSTPFSRLSARCVWLWGTPYRQVGALAGQTVRDVL